MAIIYIKDETREMLDRLVIADKRNLSDEMDYLVGNRFKELGLPDVPQASVASNPIETKSESQEKSEQVA